VASGASATFLRIFFVPDDSTPTTLLVQTPEGDWLCARGTSAKAPTVDIEFAPSGQYLLWAGTLDKAVTVPGRLSITQDRDVEP
jgi:hypothetical protein